MTSFKNFIQLIKFQISQSKKKRGFEPMPHFAFHFAPDAEKPVTLPVRATQKSAGYDICAIGEYIIQPGEKVIIITGVTAYMKKSEYLALFVRSGLAYKHNLTLQNGTGVVDSDFYGNHIRILLRNEGTEPFVINHGDRIAQGIFQPYLLSDKDSLVKKAIRFSGFGSTGVKSA